MESTKPLPCPFCGCKDIRFDVNFHDNRKIERVGGWGVESRLIEMGSVDYFAACICTGCKSRSDMVKLGSLDLAKQYAVKKWNTRDGSG